MLQDKKETAFKLIFTALLIVGLVIGAFLFYKVFQNRENIFGYSKLTVNVLGAPAKIYFDNQELGESPLEHSSIKPGNHTIKLQNDNNLYETTLTFSKNSQVVVSRDLGISNLFSSGQIFSLDDKDLSSKINVVSSPSQAKVFIDDSEVGQTPYSSTVLTDNEYDLRIEKPGYEPQIARIKIQKNYKLNVTVQLFPIPSPDNPQKVGTSSVVYDLASENEELILDPSSWAKGVVYWTNTRQKAVKFTYFVDYMGGVYDFEGKSIGGSDAIALKSGDSIGYLGRKSDNGITTEANASFTRFGESSAAAPSGTIGTKVKVLNTGTGWLRVRSEPTLTATEIARLNVSDEVSVLEEKSGWYKVTTTDGKTGWISASYTSKVTN